VKAAEQLRNSQRRAEKLVIFTMPLMQFVMYACMVSIVWFGGSMIIAGSMQTGELMGFLSYVSQILNVADDGGHGLHQHRDLQGVGLQDHSRFWKRRM
jgi:ABC-type multidrug transport system fused ATPase/permease subunit